MQQDPEENVDCSAGHDSSTHHGVGGWQQLLALAPAAGVEGDPGTADAASLAHRAGGARAAARAVAVARQTLARGVILGVGTPRHAERPVAHVLTAHAAAGPLARAGAVALLVAEVADVVCALVHAVEGRWGSG